MNRTSCLTDMNALLSIPRLTREEEHRLAVRMRRMYRTVRRLEKRLEGAKPNRVRFLPEAIAIARRQADEARNALILPHMSFLVYIAKRFRDNPRRLTLEELVSAGYLAMLRSAHRYVATRGARFLSYVGQVAFLKMRRAAGYGFMPQRERILRGADPVILAESIRDDRSGGIPDMIDAEVREYRLAFVHRCMEELPRREQAVLHHRYGGEGAGLRSVGDRLGITHETARKVEMKALQKLRVHVATPFAGWQANGCPALAPGEDHGFTWNESPDREPTKPKAR